jgi:hypothetical protein
MTRHLVQAVPFNHRYDGQLGYEAQMESVLDNAASQGWTLAHVWPIKEDVGQGILPRVTMTLVFERERDEELSRPSSQFKGGNHVAH